MNCWDSLVVSCERGRSRTGEGEEDGQLVRLLGGGGALGDELTEPELPSEVVVDDSLV